MRVAELIEKLQAMPQDAPVVIGCYLVHDIILAVSGKAQSLGRQQIMIEVIGNAEETKGRS